MKPAEMMHRGWPAFAALLLFAFAFQGSRGLYFPDEGRYTDVALEMVDSRDWIHPRLHAEVPHYTKPPLTYWAVAAAIGLGGKNEWAARAPNAFAFALTVLMLWRLGRRFVPAQPVLPAIIYASFVFPYFAANLVTTDTLLTAAEALTFWGFVEFWWRSEHPRNAGWAIVSAVGAALAFLAKGPPGLLPLAAVVLFAALVGGRAGLTRLWSLRAIAVFDVLALWWYVKVALDSPELVRYFIVEEVWNRVASDDMHRHPEWYGGLVVYVPTLLLGALPWMPLWVAPFVRAWRTRTGAWRRLMADPPRLLLWLWLLVPLAVFFVSRSRLPLYLLPLFVPLALLTARAFAPLELRRPWVRGLLGAWLAILVVLRAAPVWLDVDNDDRRLARELSDLAPQPIGEIAFVEQAAHYGLRLYLDTPIERLHLPDDDHAEPQSELLESELIEDEGCRLLIVQPDKQDRLMRELVALGHRYTMLGERRGQRVLAETGGACFVAKF